MDNGSPADRTDLRKYVPLFVVLAAVCAYSNSFQAPFIFDDTFRIVENLGIRRLWPPWGEMHVSTRPVTNLSLAVNYAIGGLHVRDYHLFNLAVHVLAGLALFGVVRRTLARGGLQAKCERTAPWLALVVSLFWTLHPLQTESVTYVIQRAEALMGMFFLLAVYCFVRGVDSPRRRMWYCAAVGSCALGMASKETMVIAPVVILLYDRTFVAGSFREAFRRRRGLHAGAMATWIILIVLLATSPQFPTLADIGFGSPTTSRVEYALTQPGVILKYISLSFWPHPLCLDYRWPVARSAGAIVPPLVLILGLFGATVWALVRRPGWGFLGAWFFLTLAPTSSFVPISDLAFEHRMYLPLAAVVTLVVIGGYEIPGRLFRLARWSDGLRALAAQRSGSSRRFVPYLWGGLAVAAAVTLGCLAYRRNEDYRNTLTMWSDVVAKRPGNARAYAGLGRALLGEGRIEEAIAQLNHAVRIDPRTPRALNNLGLALMEQERWEEAIEQFRKALRLSVDCAQARTNLGLTLANLGKVEEARAAYEKALESFSESGMRGLVAMVNLGALELNAGNYEEAARWFRRARKEAPPTDPRPTYNLAVALERMGHLEEAKRLCDEVLELEGHTTPFTALASFDFADVYVEMGVLAQKLGRPKEAVERFEEALRRSPDHPRGETIRTKIENLTDENEIRIARRDIEAGRCDEAIRRLRPIVEQGKLPAADAWTWIGEAYKRKGEREKARAACEKALELYSQSGGPGFRAMIKLGTLELEAGRFEEAARWYRKARKSAPPTVPHPAFNLALALERMGQLDEAYRLCEEAIKLEGRTPPGAIFNFTDVHIEMGVLAQKLGRPKEAVERFEEALRRSPDHPQREAIRAGIVNLTDEIQLAQRDIEAGRYDEAIRRLRPVAEQGKLRAGEAWFWIGKAHKGKGEREKARAAYEKALGSYSQSGGPRFEAMMALGTLELEAGRYEEAARWYRKARKDAPPTDPRPAFNLALALERMGQLEEAYRLCEEALRLEGRIPPGVPFDLTEVHLEMGILAQKLGRPKEAVERFEEALRRSPDHPKREAIRATIGQLRARLRAPQPGGP